MYIVASIGFFLFALRSIFFWTFLWQKNGYAVSGILATFQEYSREKKEFYRISLFIFLFSVVCYGIVIFNDSLTFWYQLFVTVLFTIGGLSLIREIFGRTFLHPVFTLRAFTICLPSICVIALLYMVPLVDSYVWMVFLTLIMPVFVAAFVAFTAFPAEIYTDFVTQKALQALQKNPDLFSIALIGNQTSLIKQCLYELLTTSYSVIKTPNESSFVDIMQRIARKMSVENNIFIFDVPFKNKEIKFIFPLVKPRVLIITHLEESENLLKSIPKHTIVLCVSTNTSFIQRTQKSHKNILIYGPQKTMQRRKIALYPADVKVKKQGISWKIRLQKQTLIFRNIDIEKEELVFLLPALFIARHLKISVQKIQNTLAALH